MSKLSRGKIVQNLFHVFTLAILIVCMKFKLEMKNNIIPPNADGQTIIGIGMEFLYSAIAIVFGLISSGIIVIKLAENKKVHIAIKVVLIVNALLLIAILKY